MLHGISCDFQKSVHKRADFSIAIASRGLERALNMTYLTSKLWRNTVRR